MRQFKKKEMPAKGKYLYGAAKLFEFASGWVIEYRYYDQESKQLISHRERFQRIRKKINCDTEARKEAKRRCKEIDIQLSNGWTPYGNYVENDERLKVTEALDRYYNSKRRELRPDSDRTYRSQINILKEWLVSIRKENIPLDDFDYKLAYRYLDYIYDKGVRNRTYNNYISVLKSIWNWFVIEREFIDVNPFIRPKTKKEEEKIRKPIPPEWDAPILKYCDENDPVLGLVCKLIYSSFLRPAEICRCIVSEIDLANCVIYLSGNKAKNHTSRIAPLSPDVVCDLIKLGVEDLNPNQHLIGKNHGKVGSLKLGGNKELHIRELERNWDSLRININLPKHYQLYSWRDTGLSDMLLKGYSEDDLSKVSGHLNKWQVNAYKSKDVDVDVALRYIESVSILGDREKDFQHINSTKISKIQATMKQKIGKN